MTAYEVLIDKLRANSKTVTDYRAITTAHSVAWWPVHEYVEQLLAQADSGWPVAGTPAWCALPDGDPRKVFALIAASEHHVLRMEAAQEARAEASKAISAAADWPAVAREIRHRDEARRRGARIERRPLDA